MCRRQVAPACLLLLLLLHAAAGMSDTEQVLACLHSDAIMLLRRLELHHGLQEAVEKVTTRQQRLQASLQKRDHQADIFGARTRKERRLDAAAVQQAGQTPKTAPVSSSLHRLFQGLL